MECEGRWQGRMRTEKGDRHEAERSCARKGFKETERKRKLKVEGGEKKQRGFVQGDSPTTDAQQLWLTLQSLSLF